MTYKLVGMLQEFKPDNCPPEMPVRHALPSPAPTPPIFYHALEKSPFSGTTAQSQGRTMPTLGKLHPSIPCARLVPALGFSQALVG